MYEALTLKCNATENNNNNKTQMGYSDIVKHTQELLILNEMTAHTGFIAASQQRQRTSPRQPTQAQTHTHSHT